MLPDRANFRHLPEKSVAVTSLPQPSCFGLSGRGILCSALTGRWAWRAKAEQTGRIAERGDGDEGTIVDSNRVLARVWLLIGEHGSTEKIAEAMLAEYEVDDRRLRQDLDDLIRQLRDKGLVTTDGE